MKHEAQGNMLASSWRQVIYFVLSQGVFLIFIFCIAQQLVCLESLRHEPCCPTGTKKRKDGDDREGGQEGGFHAKQEPSDEPRPYPVVRTEGGEPPPRKGLRLQVFETQSRDESHERKAYRFSDPERQAPSHRPSGEEACAGQPGGSGPPMSDQLLRKRRREEICRRARLVTQSTRFPINPSTRKVRVRILDCPAGAGTYPFLFWNSKGKWAQGEI